MRQDDPQMKVRIPTAVKAWVEQAAASARRSQNAQIVVVLEEAMQRASSQTLPQKVSGT